MTSMPVVAGFDGSAESLRAVEWAADAARQCGVPLRIVSVPAAPPRMHGYPGAAQMITDILLDVTRRALSEALTRVGEVAPGLSVATDLLSGAPALAVTGSGAGALMLVVGARGTGGFGAMLLGSVSRHAAMHASCPVIVVREKATAIHREIVVGVRDRNDSGAALGFAFDEAARRGASLVVVHSRFWPPSAHRGSGRLEDAPWLTFAELGENLAAELASWQEKYPDVPVRTDVVHGHPGRVLADYSAHADLVVLGRHAAVHAAGAIGGIQHALLSHAQGPVAVVPSEGRCGSPGVAPVAGDRGAPGL